MEVIVKGQEQQEASLKRFMKHALKSDLLTKWASVKERAIHLPVCPVCERFALRDRRPTDPKDRPVYITCPVCDYHGPQTIAGKTYVFEEIMNTTQEKIEEERAKHIIEECFI